MSSTPGELSADPAASPLARVAGVFGSPGPTFESIARRPGWVLPLAIATLLSLAATAALMPRIDFDTVVREAFAKRQISMPEDRMEQAIQTQKRIGTFFGYIWGLVGPTIIALLLALIYWVSFKAFGWDLKYRQSFGVTSHALLPYIGLSMLLILFVTRVDIVNPADLGDMTHTNLGFLVDRTTNPVLHSLAASLDVFTIWVLVLLVIGLAIAAKVSRKKAATVVLSLWGLFVLGKAGWVAIAG